MKNLIEYLCLFIVLIVFSPNNIFTLIFLTLNIIEITTYSICYKVNKKKSDKGEESLSFDHFKIVILTMMVVVNLIGNFGNVNLVFGMCMLSYLVVYMIVSIRKKDYLFQRNLISSKYIFDIYCAFCGVKLIIELVMYAIH